MKKTILSLFIASMALISCERDITTLNDDTKNPATVNPEFTFASAELGLVTQMTSPSVNINIFRFFTQQWSETQYTDESVYNLPKRRVPDNHWNILYAQLLKLEQVKAATNTIADASLKASRIATIEALEIYTYSILVDSYGDIPYSQSIKVDQYPNPAYDDGKAIYVDLIKRADAALALLASTSAAGFGTSDAIFGGDKNKIKAFINSTKLRLGLNLADVDNALAKSTVESAVSSGVVLTNGENIGLKFAAAGPFVNPIFIEMVSSGRNDFIPSDVYLDAMNAESDPRRASYFTKAPSGQYVGGVYGSENVYGTFSHVNPEILKPDNYAYLFDAAEVNFMLAEAAERGYSVGGAAATYFTNGIKASMDFWGVSASDRDAYVLAHSYATLPGTWKQKIGNEAWIATHNRGFESWEFSRRLDFRVFVKPETRDVPTRLYYPINEGSVNGVNRANACVKQWGSVNGDVQGAKVFWDKL
ncbi:SusD/RagB family nutrient-binding outer membrane lipoprotein [Chryseobacterium oncorhynchi]|uniref:SusD/RagB family nutrient-binding outer membrane lipoprotein n=1 Tax=Chryseobacterium oncorhynchi TaxID=741074 RepID=A0A316WRX8_9FLAO|nr:SusD/RagB family nutrient-binding outer membrane lipoprotein [Chryseobacterium oncorhynchi]PWN63256.1 SusD/RagB family nutrient-binding outer membrane lipoprotein [Chryseobacterium oncorhynchi]